VSVRKRKWKTSKGEEKEAWAVDYVDQHGKRHLKAFPTKKSADAYRITVGGQVRDGVHTATSASITVVEAGGRTTIWSAQRSTNISDTSTCTSRPFSET
jgi:hypothetical protein